MAIRDLLTFDALLAGNGTPLISRAGVKTYIEDGGLWIGREPVEVASPQSSQTLESKPATEGNPPRFDFRQRPINANCVAMVDRLRVPVGISAQLSTQDV